MNHGLSSIVYCPLFIWDQEQQKSQQPQTGADQQSAAEADGVGQPGADQRGEDG